MWGKRAADPAPSSSSKSGKPSTGSARTSERASNAPRPAQGSNESSRASSATTQRQGDEIRAANSRLHQNAEAAARESTEAAEMLRKMQEPREDQGPTQLQDLIDAVTALTLAVARIEQKIDARDRRSATVVPIRP